jgi:hypothetical protein
MSYSTRKFGLGAALMMSSALVITPGSPSAPDYEASLTGAMALELRGTTAEFGAVPGSPGPFVITLGATSERGAVLFTRWNGRQPGAGTYAITADPSEDGIQALVVTGSPTRPMGVFRAERGSLTVTRSGGQGISARFQMEAVGFTADAPEQEDRQLSVRGAFTASPSR